MRINSMDSASTKTAEVTKSKGFFEIAQHQSLLDEISTDNKSNIRIRRKKEKHGQIYIRLDYYPKILYRSASE